MARVKDTHQTLPAIKNEGTVPPRKYGMNYLSHRGDKLEAIISETKDSRGRTFLLAKWQNFSAAQATWEFAWRFKQEDLDAWAAQKRRLETIERFADQDDTGVAMLDAEYEVGTILSPASVVQNAFTGQLDSTYGGAIDDMKEGQEAAKLLLMLHAADTTADGHDKCSYAVATGPSEHNQMSISDSHSAESGSASAHTIGTMNDHDALTTQHTEDELDCASTLSLLKYAS